MATLTASARAISGTSHWIENLWQTQDLLEKLSLAVGLEMSEDPPGGARIYGLGWESLD